MPEYADETRIDRTAETNEPRDIFAELECPTSGQNGIPVDAVCSECYTARAKYAPEDAVCDDRAFRSFCSECCGAKLWNIARVLEEVDG